MRTRILLIPALIWLSGCQGTEPQSDQGASGAPSEVVDAVPSAPTPLVDAAGRTLTLQAPPGRIVSLVPSASQVLLALGVGHRIVGRTEFDDAPELAEVPSVGGGLNPNLEALVALDPDLVIRFAGESDAATPERLDALGIPHMAIRPDGLEDIRETIRHLGLMAGREGAAQEILRQMAQDLDRLREKVADQPPVRVAYLLGGNPPWVAGPGSYLHQLLELAGGVNVFSDLEGLYGPVNVEAFLAREMDLILVPEGATVHLPDLAVPIRRVPFELEIPGPDLAQQARALARALHPTVFP